MKFTVPDLYPKQKEFCKSKARFTLYGGARGGGKSFVVRVKAILLCMRYPGIQILLLRRTLKELRENHVIPLMKMLNTEDKDKTQRTAEYKDVTKEFIFPNGSRIVLGYCDNENDVLQFQGQSYDVIIIDEATHFTEFMFTSLTECLRPSTTIQEAFRTRMYLSANPGGVGHAWVKRLFIDRDYRQSEREEDYAFIPALVFENIVLLEKDPDYVRMLENLPENRRKAMLYGDWNVFEGKFFTEFDPSTHVIPPFKIPDHWLIYRTLDYGLDMTAAYWIAVDTEGTGYVFQELCESNLIVSAAAHKIDKMSENMNIELSIAPPDIWSRSKDTGRSPADTFADNGVYWTQGNNERINGWLQMKEWLQLREMWDERTQGQKLKPKLLIFSTCQRLIHDIQLLQYSDKKVNDAATDPHDITHSNDAIRLWCMYWTISAPPKARPAQRLSIWEQDMIDDYYNAPLELRRRMEEKYGIPVEKGRNR